MEEIDFIQLLQSRGYPLSSIVKNPQLSGNDDKKVQPDIIITNGGIAIQCFEIKNHNVCFNNIKDQLHAYSQLLASRSYDIPCFIAVMEDGRYFLYNSSGTELPMDDVLNYKKYCSTSYPLNQKKLLEDGRRMIFRICHSTSLVFMVIFILSILFNSCCKCSFTNNSWLFILAIAIFMLLPITLFYPTNITSIKLFNMLELKLAANSEFDIKNIQFKSF